MGALGALAICISLETEKVITEFLQALPDFMSSLVPQVRDQGWTLGATWDNSNISQVFSECRNETQWPVNTQNANQIKDTNKFLKGIFWFLCCWSRSSVAEGVMASGLPASAEHGFAGHAGLGAADICGFMSFHPHRAKKDHRHASCSFKLAEVGEGNADFHSSWDY